jgi:cobalt-precorrin 5A hydrolase
MRVAGIGFRHGVTLAALREALLSAGPEGISAVATISGKTQTPALQSLAREFDLPIKAIPAEILASIGDGE